MKASFPVAAFLAALVWTSTAMGAPFLSHYDSIIAIDADAPSSLSNYRTQERPALLLDGLTNTKYLNIGGSINTGFMVQPLLGSSIVQSMSLSTANDQEGRDPATYKIYGTNDAVDLFAPGVDNGDSLIPGVNWSLISEGSLALPATRQTAAPIVSFANSTAYTTYRVLFPTVKTPSTLQTQISEFGLYTENDGVTGPVLSSADSIAAFQLPVPNSRYSATQAPRFAIDTIPGPSGSIYPSGEAPLEAIDGLNESSSKYLNNSGANSGFIVTPALGSSIVQSLQLTTANDSVNRDPASYQLFGTNESIVSTDNSYGLGENWTLIQEGLVALPPERLTVGELVPVTNTTSYTSYKLLFPTLKGVNQLMQIGEASLFSTPEGTPESDILNAGDPILAINATVQVGVNTKYVNLGRENSGFIVTPQAGSKIITGFQISTANDQEGRDPASFELYGTNDTIASTDNSQGTGENWTLIASDVLALPTERLTAGDLVPITNSTAYTSYKLVFPTRKNAADTASLQFSQIQFFDDSAVADVDLDNDGDVDGNDFLLIQRTDSSLISAWKVQFGATGLAVSATAGVPEPTSCALLVIGGIAAIAARRRGARR
jgi:hypothetical protein